MIKDTALKKSCNLIEEAICQAKSMDVKQFYFERGHKDLVTREGPRIGNFSREARRFWPEKDKLNWNVHIVGFRYQT